MRNEEKKKFLVVGGVAIALAVLLAAPAAWATDEVPKLTVQESEAAGADEVSSENEDEAAADAVGEEGKSRLELYGFVMTDVGYQTARATPDWFDVMRPTKLPAYENEYGTDGNVFAGVRQSRLGVKTLLPHRARRSS